MAKGKRARRRTPRSKPTRRINIEELVQIQQDSVRRVFDFWANAATRVARGNFRVSEWSDEYSAILDESIDDCGRLLKSLFGGTR